MTAITFTGTNPTVGASTDTWGTTLNTGRTQIKADLEMLNTTTANSILGRVTAGTGEVERLTGTQATTLLSAVVGDSGSGGTKGVVPAPAAGDALAGKVLSAAGTWVAGVSCYAIINASGTVLAGSGLTCARSLAGKYDFTFTTTRASANYLIVATAYDTSSMMVATARTTKSTTTFSVWVQELVGSTFADPVSLSVMVLG